MTRVLEALSAFSRVGWTYLRDRESWLEVHFDEFEALGAYMSNCCNN